MVTYGAAGRGWGWVPGGGKFQRGYSAGDRDPHYFSIPVIFIADYFNIAVCCTRPAGSG